MVQINRPGLSYVGFLTLNFQVSFSRLRFGRDRLMALGFLFRLNYSPFYTYNSTSEPAKGDFVHNFFNCPRSFLCGSSIFFLFFRQ